MQMPLEKVEKSVTWGLRKGLGLAPMYCPQCKAEYRPGFTHCTDCDVELVENYVEAVRHPMAKKVAVGDEYGARLWHGPDPHFYVGLVGSLWNKKIASFGVPEH